MSILNEGMNLRLKFPGTWGNNVIWQGVKSKLEMYSQVVREAVGVGERTWGTTRRERGI